MDNAPQFGSLEAALRNGQRLLASEPEAALEQAQEILRQDAANRPAMRLLARALRRVGRIEEAAQTETDAIAAASNEPVLVRAAQSIQGGAADEAEKLLQPYLNGHPDDPAALRLMAEVAAKAGRVGSALEYLRQAIAQAPTYISARLKLANVLYLKGDYPAAIEELDQLLKLDPEQGNARASKAAALLMIGEIKDAARLYEQLLDKSPDKPAMWVSYAHVLNTLGRFDESVAAYRRAIALQPTHGDAWWSLANLKVARFTPEDVSAMLSGLDQPELDDKNRVQLHFALGKAFEDGGDYDRSFDHYASGNRLQANALTYDPATNRQLVRDSEATFTRACFSQWVDAGAQARDPIFVLGMPRAGSTLVEQILSTHSMIEGTAELPYMPGLQKELGRAGSAYPGAITRLSAVDLQALGERYLSSARAHRKTDRPFFIDKLPNNWENVGLILAILPNARIVDARRHPMACGFSNFKQLYARGQEFSYSLDWMGRYYADYVRMMRHFDELFPGRIHRVIHERLIDNPDEEIRRLLDYVGVPFEEACLRFYENERPVRTPSAGQVRQPLNRKGVDQWRNFEPWLDDLKQALGPVLDAYPDVPERFPDQ